ncbi:MAG: DUF2282 domain-containing protein [Gammaproteobacteria bacterium]|nr:DUF2282 domain-containing protein [Gammaproteobacteria bacterium]
MSTKTTLVTAAIGSLLALAAASASAEDAAKEKCYGVAKAGQNGCAANGHGCAGQAKVDNDPAEWKHVEKGQCETMGGSTEPGKKGA